MVPRPHLARLPLEGLDKGELERHAPCPVRTGKPAKPAKHPAGLLDPLVPLACYTVNNKREHPEPGSRTPTPLQWVPGHGGSRPASPLPLTLNCFTAFPGSGRASSRRKLFALVSCQEPCQRVLSPFTRQTQAPRTARLLGTIVPPDLFSISASIRGLFDCEAFEGFSDKTSNPSNTPPKPRFSRDLRHTFSPCFLLWRVHR